MASDVSTQWSLRTRVAALLLLSAAGVAGNYFKYPIFLNIDFLFGSIFAMLVLQLLGLRQGVVAAALIASVTYPLWNHPYAVIIMTAEVAVVGWIMQRHRIGLVVADTVYWLLIGMPLAFIFYHGVMDVSLGNTMIVMAKQAVNGIANALLARLVFTGWVLATRNGQIAYRDLIYNLLAFFALFPALALLMVSSHRDFLETDLSIRNDLHLQSVRLSNRMDVWSRNRATPLRHLAELALTLTPAQMQTRLDQALASDTNFLRIGLLNADATSTAFSPRVDELGLSNIGRNFSDRPFIARLQESLKPMLSEVIVSRIGPPKPMVTLLAPVVRGDTYGGAITGALSLQEMQRFLELNTQSTAMLYTVVDTNGNVIVTNRPEQQVLNPLARGPGQLHVLDTHISQWVPALPPNTPIAEQWKSSFYVTETSVGELAQWHLILEQPVAPFQQLLYAQYTSELVLLFLLLLTALATAEFLSRKVAARTEQLSTFTKDLPANLGRGVQPVWPHSNLTEHRQLIARFKEMAESLATQFNTNRQLTASLELRVAQRTAALANSEAKYRMLIENSHDIIYTLNADGEFTYVSKAWTTLLGHPIRDVLGHTFMPFVHPDDLAVCMAAMADVFHAGQQPSDVEYRVLHADGSWRWHSSNAVPVRDETGRVVGFEGIAADITDRKLMETQVRQHAFYDALTTLPNRRLLHDRLGQAMAASKRSASYGVLMFLDLDNFKPLNDAYGHAMGDLLLIEVANRLMACVRGMDTVARFGGDEFVVLLGDLDKDQAEATEQAHVVAEKIHTALMQPYFLTAHHNGTTDGVVEHHCSASIGVVVFLNYETSQEDILRCADAAMYQAKAVGRNVIRFYEETDRS